MNLCVYKTKWILGAFVRHALVEVRKKLEKFAYCNRVHSPEVYQIQEYEARSLLSGELFWMCPLTSNMATAFWPSTDSKIFTQFVYCSPGSSAGPFRDPQKKFTACKNIGGGGEESPFHNALRFPTTLSGSATMDGRATGLNLVQLTKSSSSAAECCGGAEGISSGVHQPNCNVKRCLLDSISNSQLSKCLMVLTFPMPSLFSDTFNSSKLYTSLFSFVTAVE